MFSSHPSLYSKTQGSQDGYPIDGAGDFSQLQNAQCTQFEMFSENSQENSQMFYSQNEENSSSNSEGFRRAAVYEKYIAKPSLFGGRGRGRNMNMNGSKASQNSTFNNSNQNFMKLPGQQNNYLQAVSQKAKAKDRDERDLLGSIVKMVKECSDEVKSSLISFKESGESKTEDLQNSMKMLAKTFDESSNKILKAVTEKENHLQKVHTLERELLKKEEEMRAQKQQNTNSYIEDKCAMFYDTMKIFIGEQQQQMEQKLQHVIETMQEQLTIVKDFNQNKKSSLEEGNKNFQDMKYSNQRQLHDIEKRLIDEIVQVRDDFDRQKRDMENFYRNQMQSFHLKQTRDIEQCLKQGIENAFQKAEFLTTQDIQESNSEMISKSQLLHRQMESHINNTTKQQSDHLLKHCQECLKKHKDELEKSIKDNLNTLKNQQLQLIENNNTQLQEIKKVTKMAWENENIPKHIQEKLNKLHNNHQSEIKRLESEIQQQRETAKDADEIKRHVGYGGMNMGNVYDENSERQRPRQTGPMFEKRVDFLSPRPLQGTRWNSKSLFRRTNPSPVATVLPQRKLDLVRDIPSRNWNSNTDPPLEDQVVVRGHITDEIESQQDQLSSSSCQSTQANEHYARDEASPVKKKGSRKRKNNWTVGRKRRGKKRCQETTNMTVSNNIIGDKTGDANSANNIERNKNTKSTTLESVIPLVYDFSDDDHSLSRIQPTRGSNLSQNHFQPRSTCISPQNRVSCYSKPSFNSLPDNKCDVSLKSSPSLSITEVMITRTVQSGVVDQTNIGQNRASQYNSDVFSSPKTGMFELCQSKGNNPGEMMLNHHNTVQVPKMRNRRKLCDFDTHTQVFQLIQCLQKNTF